MSTETPIPEENAAEQLMQKLLATGQATYAGPAFVAHEELKRLKARVEELEEELDIRGGQHVLIEAYADQLKARVAELEAKLCGVVRERKAFEQERIDYRAELATALEEVKRLEGDLSTRVERCCECNSLVSDWVEAEHRNGRICRPCETLISVRKSLCESEAACVAMREALVDVREGRFTASDVMHFLEKESAGQSLLTRLSTAESTVVAMRNEQDAMRADARKGNEYIFMLARLLGCSDGDETPEIRIAAMRAEIAGLEKDRERLDWLEIKTVNVRIPMAHGSRDLFWSSPDDDEDRNAPSDIRQAIDRHQGRLTRAPATEVSL